MNSLKLKVFDKLRCPAIYNCLDFKRLFEFPQPATLFSLRTTFVLKRKYPLKLTKVGVEHQKFKAKDYVYELVEHLDSKKKPEISVILKEYVDGLGQRGDIVKVRRTFAYNKLLVTGLADYATPEAIEQAKLTKTLQPGESFSSSSAPMTVKFLENMQLSIIMNKDVEWTLEPWHVRVAFRKAGVHVPTNCIELPVKPIQGPNLDLQSKIFCINVKINNRERATVRCAIHHWSTNPGERLPYEKNPWTLPREPLFPEDVDKLAKLPVIKYKKDAV